MKFLLAVLKGLDPWAALLLGVLVSLTVVILLATPGPWQKVVGLTPAARALPPENIAVFVQGGTNRQCTGVVWLHADHRRVSLTATVLAPRTQGQVSGGGYVPLHRLVDDLGPQAAAQALGQILDVELDAWVVLDRDALRLAVPTMFSGGQERPRLALYREAAKAWRGQKSLASAWPSQYGTLSQALPQIAFEDLNVVAFANYVLAFGIMQNELDLQAATSVASTLRALRPARIRVRSCPVLVERCEDGTAWSLRRDAVDDLRHTLAVGLTPPQYEPVVTVQRRHARVLIIAPDGTLDRDAYEREARRLLRQSSGVDIAVRSLTAPPAALAERVESELAEWQPLAVLVAPSAADRTGATARATEELALLLQRLRQPAVVSAPLDVPSKSGAATSSGGVAEAVAATGLPVSALPGGVTRGSISSAATARGAARANVQTLVRACWPSTLAPGLASTRAGFSYAAAGIPQVGVLADTGMTGADEVERLRLWGYQAQALSPWQPEEATPGLYYRSGFRRAALALGGDLGLRRTQIVVDDSAPTDITLVLDDE